jgi:predicted nucleic acid-binding protein
LTYLIDTNIVSEVRKGSRCHPAVARWYETIDTEEIFLSSLVVGEVRKGIETVRRTDPTQAESLESWLAALIESAGDRMLPVERGIADEWGRLAAVRSLPIIDAILAATARIHQLTLVTRNTRDFEGTGTQLLNPFTE